MKRFNLTHLKSVVRKAGLALVMAAIALGVDAGSAFAQQDSYLSVVIENRTGTTFRYQLRWSAADEYRTFSLPPYMSYTHSHPVTEGGWNGAQIRFDWIAGNGQFDEKIHSLPVGRYYRQYSQDGRYSNLHKR